MKTGFKAITTVVLVATAWVFQGCANTSGGSGKNSAITLNDALVTAGVETALQRDADLRASHIKVHTDNGRVQMQGQIHNQEQKNFAEQDALKVQGVRSVQSSFLIPEDAGAGRD